MVFWRRKPKIALEKALEGIVWNPEIVQTCSWKVDGVKKSKRTPLYLAPVREVSGEFEIGLYTEGQGLRYFPFGLSQGRDFTNFYYSFVQGDTNAYLEFSYREGDLYLPLRTTDIMHGIGTNDEFGKWKEHNGSPFAGYTIDGLEHQFPFIIFHESDEGVSALGFYKTLQGGVQQYRNFLGEGLKLKIKDLLAQLRDGTYSLPGMTEEDERKIVVSTSKREDRKEKKELAAGNDSPAEVSGPAPEVASGKEEFSWEKPRLIKDYLDEYVIGQDEAKITVAVAFSNYMTRMCSGNPDLPKDNIILFGPSGVGKTYMVSLLAKKADLAWAEAQVSALTAEGYKGQNLSSLFEQIRAKSTDSAPYGVVFIDEIDKLAGDNWGSGGGFGPRLQNHLIGWTEAAYVAEGSNEWSMNTKNLLFVAAGAFRGESDDAMEDIVRDRIRDEKGRARVGFGARIESRNGDDDKELLSMVTPADMIKYGLKPELIGRFPSMAALFPLTNEDKVRILKESAGSRLGQYTALFRENGYSLKLEEEVFQLIIDATPKETGARALNSVCNDLFTEILFEPEEFADEEKEIVVTPEHARKFIKAHNGKKELEGDL